MVFAMRIFRTKKRKDMSEEERNIDIQEDEVKKEEASHEEEACEGQPTEGESNEEEVAEVKEIDPIEALTDENAKLKDQLLRTIAEFDNYKKRTLKEKAELILNGGEKTIIAFLPVLDDFERALADTHTDDPAAIKEGMDLIFKKFIKTLEGMGVKRIDTDGQDFDVDYHEAIAMVPGMGDDKKGKVIDCVQTGYMLNNKVIRHAKVAVGQ